MTETVEVPEIPKPRHVRLKASETIVIVVDVQNDFLHPKGSLYIGEEARKIIPNIRNLTVKAESNGVPVVYTQDWHTEDSSEFKVWPKHCIGGSWGAEIVDELKPKPGNLKVRKETYDAFYKTGLDSLLSAFKPRNLVVSGVVSNICVLHTAGSAALRGYRIYVPVDCVAALNRFDQLLAFRQISFLYKGVLTRSDLLDFY